ncbi:hypothetical protein QUB80_29690 [Chlorogloeopsis sp. ULAP01]|uniref:hypothetical protein n=1 Tax=Chlorogloeopsis sp. ULAP01 TaxID=3056483 RepID=UPI0025AAB3E2|nr:hypothetical protein [Chlorogloeopsis sp. ULAP01]MDM9384834.1 hypothetical protein [Chlorogloeopsis sp. ULAP01]
MHHTILDFKFWSQCGGEPALLESFLPQATGVDAERAQVRVPRHKGASASSATGITWR